jgi:hypothetical protein
MITNDKKEWKKSIKCPIEGRELQPLSPPEDFCLSISPQTTRLRYFDAVFETFEAVNELKMDLKL